MVPAAAKSNFLSQGAPSSPPGLTSRDQQLSQRRLALASDSCDSWVLGRELANGNLQIVQRPGVPAKPGSFSGKVGEGRRREKSVPGGVCLALLAAGALEGGRACTAARAKL